jgi:hypothetical protein
MLLTKTLGMTSTSPTLESLTVAVAGIILPLTDPAVWSPQSRFIADFGSNWGAVDVITGLKQNNREQCRHHPLYCTIPTSLVLLQTRRR